jgi:uncharacterized sulfatase
MENMSNDPAMPKRPNILLITTDQQRADHLGVAGLSAVPTPHLDRLGREGVHFQRAYTPSPVCTPARVSLLTGLYPSRHGAYTIGVSRKDIPQPTLPSRLGDAGYATALFGKTHFVTRKDEMAHVTGDENPEPDFFKSFTGPYLGFDKIAISGGHTINAVPDGHYRVFLEQAGVDYRPWFPQMGPNYDHDAVGVWDIPPEFHDSTWVGQNTIDYIEQQATGNQPWFAWASFQDPHEPHVCPQAWMDRVDPSKMEIPEGYREGEFDDRPDFYKRAYETGDFGGIEDDFSVPCASRRQKLTNQAKTAMHATLGMIAGIDDQIGRIFDALEATGQADNTLIVFTSDHGEYHGHHGFWGKGLPAYEDAQSVPLLVWGPGLGVRPQATDSLASLIDLPTTFLDYAGLQPTPGMQGTSLRPLLCGEQDAVRHAVLVELRAVEKFSQHTYITAKDKLVVYETLENGEFYDLEKDPDQYENLWHHPDWQARKQARLLELCRFHQGNEGRHIPRTAFA